ncbi:arylsulfatase [Paenibacillus oceani]|uniref:Arylsulfatase n=1 Tax=Paenibacillus oceani TaxID=2772510 RepID=A0A927H0B7_9BACL|nr:arylsulfatase [Paenibacillus oceani]MBD2862309.1 arylsulfatase [Paenibacillus oceani]
MANKPNVLLLMTDQQRWDTLGCYGNRVIETPNLDWLASQGTVFTSAYSSTPSCVPARASLITGMNPWNTGILGTGKGQGPMGVGFEHTLPGELAKSGYHTRGIGKMSFHPMRALNGFHHTVLDEFNKVDEQGIGSDFRSWFDRNKTGDYEIFDHGIGPNSWMARPTHAPEFLHPTFWTIKESIEFLNRRDPTKPFFLKVSFSRPHSPYDPPAFYFDLYANKKMPEPHVGEWASMHDVPQDAASPDAWRGGRSAEETRRARAGYYGSIHFIDHQIGRLLQFMTKHKLLRDTIVIFTSDHGDMQGDHNLWRKTYAYEGSAHIPLIVKLPAGMGTPATQRVENPVCLQDIMPTILEAAGTPIPQTVDGRSLLPLMQGECPDWRPYVHGEHSTCYSEEQEMQYLTDGKWKYIWFPRIGSEQLFDLRRDPAELNDLAGSEAHASELLMWRERLIGVLAPRSAGLTDGNRLVCQAGKPPIVSPHYAERTRRSGAML